MKHFTIPPFISGLLVKFSRALPPKLGATFYYRILSRLRMGAAAYTNTPLAFAPGFKMNLMPGDTCHGSIAFTGCYELPLTRRMREIAQRDGGTLIDAGANYGYYSLIWTAARTENRVIAIEASPRNFPALMGNLELNGVRDRVTTINKAAGDRVGTVHFKMSAQDQSGWDKVTTDSAESDWSVPLTTLDHEIPVADYTVLKIDCEGFDFNVVRGAQRLLEARHIKHIFFEENMGCSQMFGVAEGEIGRHLVNLGYAVSPLGGATEFEATLI